MSIIDKLKGLISKDKSNNSNENNSNYWDKLRSELDSGEEIDVYDEYGYNYTIGTYKGYKYLREYASRMFRTSKYSSDYETVEICRIYIKIPKNDELIRQINGLVFDDYSINIHTSLILNKLGLLDNEDDSNEFIWLNVLMYEEMRALLDSASILNCTGSPIYLAYGDLGLKPEIEYCKGVIDNITRGVRKVIQTKGNICHVVYDDRLYKFIRADEEIPEYIIDRFIRVILPFISNNRDITDLELLVGVVQLDDGTVIELN